MKPRLAAVFYTILVFLTPRFLYAQAQSYAQYASGSTPLRASFDPLAPAVQPRLPQTSGTPITIPRPSVIPEQDYIDQKSVPSRAAQSALPGLEWFSPSGDPINLSRLPLASSPTVSFQGIQQTIYQPPSPNIAAGPEDLIQIVNSTVARYTKAGQQTNQTDLMQWFSTGNLLPVICNSITSCIFGDVNIRYDQLHGHFLMTLQVLDRIAQTSYLLISVSNGATYSSGWVNWALSERLDGIMLTSNWADFPQVGFDNVAIYIATNQFSLSTFTFQYAKLRIIKKADLYNQQTVNLAYQDIFNFKNADGSTASTLIPPQMRGRTQVGPGAGVALNASDKSAATYLTLWQINNPASNTPTATRSTLNNVWAYSYPASAPQLGTTIPLDTGPSSFNQLVLRDGLLYGAQNIGYPDQQTTVTFSIVDVLNNKVTLQERMLNGNFFYPAFDLPASIGPGYNLLNDLIMGSTTSPTGGLTFSGLVTTTGNSAPSAGPAANISISNLKAGEDFYDILAGRPAARWGDYFGGGVDPVNGGLWVSGEYAKAHVNNQATWGTWNAYFPWHTTPQFSDVASTATNFDYINVMGLWGVTRGCSTTSPPAFCPSALVSRSALASFVIRSIYGENFPYSPTPVFTDVPASDPNFKYIQKLAEQGITKGCSITPAKFCPNDIATREHAATFIIRGKMGQLFGDNFTFPATPYFTDVPVDGSGFPFIQKFREMGITAGCGVNPPMFCPNMQLTRDTAAVFIVRAFFN
jgi:hypothetical protein